MSGFSIDLDMNLLSVQMERYVRELGMDGPTVVRDQTRLLIKSLIAITPPRTLKQGRAAVARSIRRALGLINESKIRNAELRSALQRGDVTAVNAILANLSSKSPLHGFHARPYSKELHTNVRDRRGRVNRSQSVLALPTAAARKRLREVQARVGQAKGAFMPAYHAVGGSAPGWIERHGGVFGGVEDVHLGTGETDPRLTIINSARGVRSIDEGDFRSVLRGRERAMGVHIAKQLELRARENNLA